MRLLALILLLVACTKKPEVIEEVDTALGPTQVKYVGACLVSKGVHSTGIRVIRFKSGNKVISTMALRDATPEAIEEELENLRNLKLCV